MSQLDIILKYQTIDMQRSRKKDEIENSESAKKALKYKNEFDYSKKLMDDANKDSEVIVKKTNAEQEFLSQTVAKLEDLIAKLENESDAAKIDEGIKALSSLRSKIVDIEKKLLKNAETAKVIIERYKKAQKACTEAKEEYKKHLDEYNELIGKNKVVQESFKKELLELRTKGDKKLFEIYDKLVKEVKMPIFVQLVNGNTCSGCGMEMSQSEISKLKDNKTTCKCENCRREVYKA